MTGLDTSTARHYLQVANWDISIAYSLILESEGQQPSSPTVRAADPVKQERLLDQRSIFQQERDMTLSRVEASNVDWMFPPPNHLSFPRNLSEAKKAAMEDKKWILVNIQDHNEFSSHLLNRDVWTNETLVSLVRMNFLFWQRGSTSQDGQSFIGMYQLTDLPMVGVMDPRTGGLLFALNGVIDSGDLTFMLVEFLDDNDLESTGAPVVRKSLMNSVHRQKIGNGKISEAESKFSEVAGVSQTANDSSPCESLIESIEIVSAEPKYGDVTAEPEEGDDGAVKVSFRLLFSPPNAPKPGSMVTVRRFMKSDLVKNMYAYVNSILPEERSNKPFDLLTSFPRSSLNSKLEMKIEDAGLANSQVIMKWED
eukprot:CAMPEP_0185019474 /NCGR_PEP_ID=MMETSP1103-20130426/2081_1 /TAXON_ID=36769 /ORGANISM="Paraphysomonas bandaiensis, Strain Caron Lab Isolate" /LENGTH=366 /DNA_ID=CAMNT_0027549805 /DNA_START=53 /DNA_END=1153 /DNA_ORIENTATION=+